MCRMRYLWMIAFFLFVFNNLLAQKNKHKKSLRAIRIEQNVTIDGKLNENFWDTLPVATNFVEFEPYNGAEPSKKTTVKIAYDNTALYIGATLYDNPDSVLTALSERDSWSNNSDKFGIWIIPYNDGLNGFEFWVTAAGVQSDYKRTAFRNDRNWDEVWLSEVNLHEKGWTVEVKIPFSALRFPNKKEQVWGINFWRINKRTGEENTWNFVNREISGVLNQSGELTNLKNIKPPLRLSFTPYVSSYIEKETGKNISYAYKGGMDFRYGINESFTLDMMLIPDFGQVQSDDVVLNLSPYEVKYNEKRQFFTEGSELFDKANIFYSKRIGDDPAYKGDVEDSLKKDEQIIQNPTETQLLNATKVSGRTNRGWGLGVINAITGNTFAVIKDTIEGDKRKFRTQGLTNYNVAVIDKTLKNDSYVSFINTNLIRENFLANVSATDFNLKNSRKTYGIRGIGAVSHQNPEQKNPVNGHRYYLKFYKASGNFRFDITRSLFSDEFNINDMGFLRRNNFIHNSLDFDYRTYKPFWKILRTVSSINFDYNEIYEPRVFSKFNFTLSGYVQFKNYSSFRIFNYIRPIDLHDYNEPRVEGRMYREPPGMYISSSFSTDNRKDFVFSTSASYSVGLGHDFYAYNYSIRPRLNLSDKATVRYSLWVNKSFNEPRYVAKTDNEDTIFFGNRDQTTFSNVISTVYSFTKNASLSFRLRHYWSEVLHDKFYILNDQGNINGTDYSENHDLNYNAFNIDMVYTWRFAPGSEMSLVWKNAINTSEEEQFFKNYWNNLDHTLASPQLNNISIKLLYYLDYLKLKRI